jgi:hypothetical protein
VWKLRHQAAPFSGLADSLTFHTIDEPNALKHLGDQLRCVDASSPLLRAPDQFEDEVQACVRFRHPTRRPRRGRT